LEDGVRRKSRHWLLVFIFGDWAEINPFESADVKRGDGAGSNRRPSGPHPEALPTELPPREDGNAS
jgi:hypothetical protein